MYDQYAKLLEAEHYGEYIAISPTSQVLLGIAITDLARQALEALGRGNFLFN